MIPSTGRDLPARKIPLYTVHPETALATHDIFMPALSSTMTEGKIVEWLKKPGDKVARGESVLVVESDKADMDVESFNDQPDGFSHRCRAARRH